MSKWGHISETGFCYISDKKNSPCCDPVSIIYGIVHAAATVVAAPFMAVGIGTPAGVGTIASAPAAAGAGADVSALAAAGGVPGITAAGGLTGIQTAALGLQAVSTVGGAVSAEKQARQAATVAGQQASLERARGETEAGRIRVQGRQIIGAQRAKFAARGVVTGEGSPLSLASQTAKDVEISALDALYGGELQARTAEIQKGQAMGSIPGIRAGGALGIGQTLLTADILRGQKRERRQALYG